MLAVLLALSIPVSAIALLYARRAYRRRGRLTVPALLLLCVMLFLPNLLLDYATRFQFPTTPLQYAGAAIGIAGLAICLAGIWRFRSLSKMLCLKTGTLTVTGLYRWSRNPQYVGYFLFLVGFALTDWSWWCLAALLVVGISLHLLVLVEEEHLHRVFGEPFGEYRRRTPRYAGWQERRA